MTIYEELAQMKAETKHACASIIKACKSIAGIIKKAIRSCLRASVNMADVNQPVCGKPLGKRSTVYPDWSESPDQHYQYRCERMRTQIDQEIRMEELHRDALEILIK